MYVICTVQRYWIDSCTLNTSSCTLFSMCQEQPMCSNSLAKYSEMAFCLDFIGLC